MKISVVTPSYNQAIYLERTLRSIHDQRGDFELEHWVIDGGSKDGSVELLERWSDRLQFVSERDRGQSHALNKGIARATGEVICWLNSDDVLLPGALAHVARVFREKPHVRWMYGRCRIINEHDVEIRRPITWYKNLISRVPSYSTLLIENYISQPSTFFRKELYDEVGGVDEARSFDMDYDLWLRFGQLCMPEVVTAELAAFRSYSQSKTGGAADESLRMANELARKYSREHGQPWLGELNYWIYYKRTSLIYRMMSWGERAKKKLSHR